MSRRAVRLTRTAGLVRDGAGQSRRAVALALCAFAAVAVAGVASGCAPTPPADGDDPALRINEVMPSNDSAHGDEAGEFDDWIEIYNAGDTEIELAGYTLSDDPLDLSREKLPAGLAVPAGGFIVLWADRQREQGPAHVNFKLDAAGESVYLSSPDKVIVDRFEYVDAPPNASFARFPDGDGTFTLCAEASPGRSNGFACGASPGE